MATAAQHALGALFRARDIERYPVAFLRCARKGRLEREMLWQLFLPRLATIDDRRIIALLGKFPRGRDPYGDLEFLKPSAVRVLGRDGWASIVESVAREAPAPAGRARIESLR